MSHNPYLFFKFIQKKMQWISIIFHVTDIGVCDLEDNWRE